MFCRTFSFIFLPIHHFPKGKPELGCVVKIGDLVAFFRHRICPRLSDLADFVRFLGNFKRRNMGLEKKQPVFPCYSPAKTANFLVSHKYSNLPLLVNFVARIARVGIRALFRA